MKKILLTSIIGFMALVPCFDCLADGAWKAPAEPMNPNEPDLGIAVANADGWPVDPIVLEKVLGSMPQINTKEFLDQFRLIVNQTGDSRLSSMVTPCLSSSINPVGQSTIYDVCSKFIQKLAEEQNKYTESINGGVEQYVLNNFGNLTHNGDILARSLDNKYIVSRVKYPKTIKNIPFAIKEQKAVFDAETDRLICAMDTSVEACKPDEGSGFAFVTDYKSRFPLVKMVDKEAYDALFNGDFAFNKPWESLPVSFLGIVEHGNIDSEQVSDALALVDYGQWLQKNLADQSVNFETAVDQCIVDAKGWMVNFLKGHGFSVTHDMISAKRDSDNCNMERCDIVVEAFGMKQRYTECVPKNMSNTVM